MLWKFAQLEVCMSPRHLPLCDMYGDSCDIGSLTPCNMHGDIDSHVMLETFDNVVCMKTLTPCCLKVCVGSLQVGSLCFGSLQIGSSHTLHVLKVYVMKVCKLEVCFTAHTF